MSIVQLKKENPAITAFLNHCHIHHYPAKQIIIHANSHSDTLYFLIKGSVIVLLEDNEEHEIILDYLNSGDFFGEMGLFSQPSNRSAWVKAKVDCEIAEISSQDLFIEGNSIKRRLEKFRKKMIDGS